MRNVERFRVGDVVYNHEKKGIGGVVTGVKENNLVFVRWNEGYEEVGYKDSAKLLSFTPYTLEDGGFTKERPRLSAAKFLEDGDIKVISKLTADGFVHIQELMERYAAAYYLEKEEERRCS